MSGSWPTSHSYSELARYAPQSPERARLLGVSASLISAVNRGVARERAIPPRRINLLVDTLLELERELGSPQAAGEFLLKDDRARRLRRNGGEHRASLLAESASKQS